MAPSTSNAAANTLEQGADPRARPGSPRPLALPPTLTAPARYVLLTLAHQLTGYTIKAMQRKIERGDWVEGQVWRRAPDGRILIDMEGYRRWVEKR